MKIIHEITEQEHLGTRLRRAGLLVLYMVLVLAALYLFAHRWTAFALLVPPVAVVVVVVFVLRIVHVMRFRHGERRHRDRRHTDRRDHLAPEDADEAVREAPPAATRRSG